MEGYFRESHRPPRTAVIRRAENTSRRTNLKTGLNISEHTSIPPKSSKEHAVQRGCSIIGSARPSTSRGKGDRYIHDTRHFIGVIHIKICELTEEIQKINWQCKEAKQEYSNSVAYAVKAKELAEDITSFQTNLADLNLAFDYINTTGDIEKLELEAKELNQINNFEKDRNEALFCERKLKEDLVHNLEVKKSIGDKINKSSFQTTPEIKESYNSLNYRLSQSLKAIKFWEKQNELYNEIQSSLIEDLQKRFSAANEIIKFEIMILDLKRKRKEVVIDSSTQRPHKEQQKLLSKVKQDTADISKMEFSINDINTKINSIQEVFDSTQLSGNELISIEAVDYYLTGFNISKEEEINKLKIVESEIVNILGELQSNLSFTSIDLLNLQEHNLNIKDISDLVAISEEHKKISNFLKKIELMEFYITQKCKKNDENCDKLKKEYEEYKSLSKLIYNVKRRENELTNKRLELEEEEPKHLKELEEAKTHLEKMQLELSENDKHKQILYLEEKHLNLEQDIILKKQNIKEIKKIADDLLRIRGETIHLMEMFNTHLISNINGA